MDDPIALWEELIIQVLFGNKMRIIVPIKQVPDMSKVKFDTEKGRTDRSHTRPRCHRPGSKPNPSLRYTPPSRMKIHGTI